MRLLAEDFFTRTCVSVSTSPAMVVDPPSVASFMILISVPRDDPRRITPPCERVEPSIVMALSTVLFSTTLRVRTLLLPPSQVFVVSFGVL